jgi:hypothetical protein
LAVPFLRRLFAGHSPCRPEFYSSPIYGNVGEQSATWRSLPLGARFSPVISPRCSTFLHSSSTDGM